MRMFQNLGARSKKRSPCCMYLAVFEQHTTHCNMAIAIVSSSIRPPPGHLGAAVTGGRRRAVRIKALVAAGGAPFGGGREAASGLAAAAVEQLTREAAWTAGWEFERSGDVDAARACEAVGIGRITLEDLVASCPRAGIALVEGRLERADGIDWPEVGRRARRAALDEGVALLRARLE